MNHHVMETIYQVIEWFALGFELLAVAVIVSAVIILAIRRGTVRYLFHLGEPGAYENYKHILARALLLGSNFSWLRTWSEPSPSIPRWPMPRSWGYSSSSVPF